MTMKEGGVPITPEVLALGWSDYVLIALVSPAHIRTCMVSKTCLCLCLLRAHTTFGPQDETSQCLVAFECCRHYDTGTCVQRRRARFNTSHALARAATYAGGLLVAASIVPVLYVRTCLYTTTSSPQLHTPPASHDRMHYHKLSFLSSWPGCRCDHGCSQQGFCRAAQDTDHATARDRRFEEGRMTRLSCLRGKDMTSVTLSPSERRYAASSQQGSTTVPFVAPARQNKKLILWFDCRLVWSY
jgi:hypothetical protein